MPFSYTLQEKRNAVTAWAKSGMNVINFCKKYGISKFSMENWIHDETINLTGKFPKRGGSKPCLSPEQVEEVIRMRKDKRTYPEIADHFGVSKETIGKICRAHPELDCFHKGGVVAKTIELPESEPEPIMQPISTFRPFEQLADAMKEASVMVNECCASEIKKSSALKLSTIQVKGEVTGFRYNVGERLMINNFVVELDDIQGFIDELLQVQKLVAAVRD